MKKITIGIIAHVDSGKTTLSEALLFTCGTIRSLGRVDKKTSFLDNNGIERSRGITVFSKQARFSFGSTDFILIDTPGHSDFSAETERALMIMDYAILLISAQDGIKGQTKVLWKLLREYNIPVYIFVNKMDQITADRVHLEEVIYELTEGQSLAFPEKDFDDHFYEQAAMCSEDAMEQYLAAAALSDETISLLIKERKLFPVFYGSALHMEGIESLLTALDRFTIVPDHPNDLSAFVYKITRDEDNTRLTFMKILGGSLQVKSSLPDGNTESKINQIRFYSGNKFITANTAEAGDICAVTGLNESYTGQFFGSGTSSYKPLLSPVLSYRVIPQEGDDPVKLFPVFKLLEEENPELSITFNEVSKDIYVNVMGPVQLEIIRSVLKERFNKEPGFDSGEVVYKETITSPVTGVGHFEPLRHYAEVHLLMEPLERGAGLVFCSSVPSDKLAKNWQRLILTHLAEKQHLGVLTGSPITDMKITLTAGKAHLKHTEGGDFRQAVYRAVRQGLMMAENILLEPYYSFILEVPSFAVGKSLTDLDNMRAEFSAPSINENSDLSMITGRGPVAVLKDYPPILSAYTKGLGTIAFTPDGYGICHDPEKVISRKAYDPLSDIYNTPDSVFCCNGSGKIIPYDEVYEYMHLAFDGSDRSGSDITPSANNSISVSESIGTDKVDAIIAAISRSNSKEKKAAGIKKKSYGKTSSGNNRKSQVNNGSAKKEYDFNNGHEKSSRTQESILKHVFPIEQAEYLLVDGYNVIFAWDDLAELAKDNIDAARDVLIEVLSKYSFMTEADVIVIFDAYRVKGRTTSSYKTGNIEVVFTKEDETADQYIEKFSGRTASKHKTAVVTSDAVEQVVTSAQGSRLISSREFRQHINDMVKQLNSRYDIK